MRFQHLISLAGLVALISCGNNPSKLPYQAAPAVIDRPDATVAATADTNNMSEVSETYYGMVTKCLVEAQEIKTAIKLAVPAIQQKIICSPKMSANSTEELARRLDLWKKSHCAATIAVKNSSCNIVADPAQNVISNDASAIEQRSKDKEYCSGKKGSSYGTPKC